MTQPVVLASRGRYLTIDEAAEYLNVSIRFMRRLVCDRRIRYYKFGKHLRFEIVDLDGFAKAGMVLPGDGDLPTQVWLAGRSLG